MTWHLHLGEWRGAPATTTGPHVVISDPPYDARTHDGRQTGSTEDGVPYRAMTALDAWTSTHAMLDRWQPEWVVLFGSHVTSQWFAESLHEYGYYVFAPLPWVKPDCAPRKQGDGPDSACEWLTVARPRRKLRRYGHRPGYYLSPTASTRGCGFAGAKPLGLMRQVVLDYSEPGDTVVDPYAGTGTTLVAALLEGRHAWGAEVDPATHARARQRIIDEHDAQPALPMSVDRGVERQIKLV